MLREVFDACDDTPAKLSKAVKENVSPAILIVDSGFVSESAVSTV